MDVHDTWAFNVTIAADEMGIDQNNIVQLKRNSTNPVIRRLLGIEGDLGKQLGLTKDWAYNIIRLVGSYNDIWNRHFTPIGLERSINASWRQGGLLVALPFE